MKYRDPSIRGCHGPVKPLIVRTQRVPKAPKVYTISGPKLPHPPIKVHDPVVGRKLPGGLPPQPNRTPWPRVGLTGKVARDPFNSRAVRGEHRATADWFHGRDWDAREAERKAQAPHKRKV